ncbi:hypothetical protein Agub_g6379 [Astrephomene gubernaculifera]|uniref:Uncharacterized protein n=1 Tax=Astrephomene gubernaculifera TaxID=47775 RepID=A0AAD3HLM5_9CHLO|nr:hypothetical protein Agub_g6379 [Astrephomene gubernaculifera]
MQPRREVWEYGGLPLQALCPQLDGVQTLLSFHGKLLARSKTGRNGQRIVTAADMAQVLELTSAQVEVLTEILAALSYANSSPPTSASQPASSSPPPPPAVGQEELYLHELSLFLLAQLFSKEAQRADAVEYWPDPSSSSSGFAAPPPPPPPRPASVCRRQMISCPLWCRSWGERGRWQAAPPRP